jgi:REP element-mobilizing transposase RayT
MARPLRIEYDGALYHVTSRGNERKAIFKNDSDRTLFLDTLAQVSKRFHWICHAYCLMDNHYHLVVETPDGNLSKGMRQLNGVYTQAYNKRHGRVGHLFQGRFKGILVQKDSHFLEVCRYVVLNPVRARTISHPRLYKWSSYRATAGTAQAHPCLTADEVLRPTKFSITSAIARRSHNRSIASLSRMGLAGLQFGMGIKRRACWDSKALPKGCAILSLTSSRSERYRKDKDLQADSRWRSYSHREILPKGCEIN